MYGSCNVFTSRKIAATQVRNGIWCVKGGKVNKMWIEYRSDPRSYKYYKTSSENKTWKRFRLVRDLILRPLRYLCSALPKWVNRASTTVHLYDFHMFTVMYSSLGGFFVTNQLRISLLAKLIERCTDFGALLWSWPKKGNKNKLKGGIDGDISRIYGPICANVVLREQATKSYVRGKT